ncbi:MAG: glycosidase, partial [Clostridia bacterium]|nr:glycosidase [Clostridia bacterium]
MAKVIGAIIPNIPWAEKPEGYKYPVWRYEGNPVITRDNLFGANSIFNSAVVPFGDGFMGVFRVDNISRDHTLVTGKSKDGINWELDSKVIFRGYDPRLCEIDGKYYLSWVNLTPHGTTIGIAYTEDFKDWVQLEDACYPVARNGVLFPRKINDRYMLLIRPCDRGHTPYGDIFIQQSPDLEFWGDYRFVMKPEKNWEMTKVGA